MLVKSVALFHDAQISETVFINPSFNELDILNNFVLIEMFVYVF